MNTVTAVIAAGGKGTRMGAGENKVFLPVDGMEMIARTVGVFEKNSRITDIVIVTGAEDIPKMRSVLEKYGYKKISAVTAGGDTRSDSVYEGLRLASGRICAVHDGARALITDDEITRVIEDCEKYGAAAVGTKSKDTLKSADENGFITGTIDREYTYNIATPQVFFISDILAMHKRAKEEGFSPTDDCAMAERYGGRVKITEGSYDNIKLTTPGDIAAAQIILERRQERSRV